MYNQGEIVLNRMYNGDYLNDNLGHEIINLYKSDNGCHYIYLQQAGTFSVGHAGRVQSVILVRTVPGKRMLEVLGKAEGITDVYKVGQSGKEQREYIYQHGITYGGVPLHVLFENNKCQQDICITFKAESVMRPKKACYISYVENNEGENVIVLTQNNQAKASLKQYIDETTPDDFYVLQSLLSDTTLWGEKVEGVEDKVMEVRPTNFFDICGIADSELAFSNALAYFMRKYPSLLVEFIRHKNPALILSEQFEVIRETEKNIDLLIRDEHNVIVVENKINSHINGRVFTRISKENEYTQLAKYFEYATKEYPNKKLSCCLLIPDHNDIDLKPYEKGDKYVKVFYSEVYDFLKNKELDDVYLREFIMAIQKHTQKYNNDLYDEMKRRFVSTLQMKKVSLSDVQTQKEDLDVTNIQTACHHVNKKLTPQVEKKHQTDTGAGVLAVIEMDSLSVIEKKRATFLQYLIVQDCNNSVHVYWVEGDKVQRFKNTLAALREVAEKTVFQFDEAWNTRYFGSKLIDFINANS